MVRKLFSDVYHVLAPATLHGMCYPRTITSAMPFNVGCVAGTLEPYSLLGAHGQNGKVMGSDVRTAVIQAEWLLLEDERGIEL